LYGHPASAVIGRPITLLTPPHRLDEIWKVMDRVRRGEVIERFETLRLRKDRGEIAVSISVAPVRDAAGAIVGASKIAHELPAASKSSPRRRKAPPTRPRRFSMSKPPV
jgi:PAS domain S-box-containing protein